MTSKYQKQIDNAICIDLSTLSSYNEISKIFKLYNIREYVYCFVYKDIIVKYGSSASGKMLGERVYRQAGNLEGWGSMLEGTSGREMRTNSDLFVKEYGYPLNRIGMKVYVIDMNPNFIQDRNKFKPFWMYCLELERELIDNCIAYHLKAPIGNRDALTKWTVRREKASVMFKKNFVIED